MEVWSKKVIELTESEREDCSDIVSITFQVNKYGIVFVTEQWEDMDEVWSDGVTVKMPTRIWIEGSAYIAEQLAKLKTPSPETPPT
jgi:hypothetical protein